MALTPVLPLPAAGHRNPGSTALFQGSWLSPKKAFKIIMLVEYVSRGGQDNTGALFLPDRPNPVFPLHIAVVYACYKSIHNVVTMRSTQAARKV